MLTGLLSWQTRILLFCSMQPNAQIFDALSRSTPNAAWGALAMEVLARLGVETVVISPGARSTPLVYATVRNETRSHPRPRRTRRRFLCPRDRRRPSSCAVAPPVPPLPTTRPRSRKPTTPLLLLTAIEERLRRGRPSIKFTTSANRSAPSNSRCEIARGPPSHSVRRSSTP